MYQRGSESVERELLKVQIWVEATDMELWPRNGNKGLIREYNDERSARTQKESDAASRTQKIVYAMSIPGVFLTIMKVLELLHVVPK